MDDGTRITEEAEKFLRAARAKDVKSCEEQLSANKDLANAVEAGGYSALHFAAFNGDTALIALLLKHKANPDAENLDGNSPLVMAVKGRQPEAIRALVAGGADVNKTTSSGAAAVHHAASMGYLDCLRLLVELGARVTSEPCECGSLLHWACHSGAVDVVGEALYTYGVDVNTKDTHGGTALLTALFMKKVEVTEFLLEHGADPNVAVPEDGTTALHIAVEHANTECVRLLCSCGANPATPNKEGKTPLDLAAAAKNEAAVKELKRPQVALEKRAEEAAKLKDKGNKVFAAGENVKAAKIYTLAIHYDNSNHVFFSNRAACYFNQRFYTGAFWDACRCMRLSPQWPKAYLRKAATELALKRYADANATAVAGLKLDPSNKDLASIKEDSAKQLKK